MASPTARNTGLLAAMMFVVALVTSCGSSTAAPQPSADQITGAASCPAAESQNLTFSGALTGHVSCSTSPALCSTRTATPSITVPLNALIGSKAVQLLVAFSFDQGGMSLLGANIHAAAAFGSREYPRSNPPSLERHLIAPVALTPRNRPLGGWSWSPRCGRSLL